MNFKLNTPITCVKLFDQVQYVKTLIISFTLDTKKRNIKYTFIPISHIYLSAYASMKIIVRIKLYIIKKSIKLLNSIRFLKIYK